MEENTDYNKLVKPIIKFYENAIKSVGSHFYRLLVVMIFTLLIAFFFKVKGDSIWAFTLFTLAIVIFALFALIFDYQTKKLDYLNKSISYQEKTGEQLKATIRILVSEAQEKAAAENRLEDFFQNTKIKVSNDIALNSQVAQNEPISKDSHNCGAAKGSP